MLITIGIVGVLFGVVIPDVSQSIEDAGLQTAYKKNFSIISQAALLAVNDNGTLDYGSSYPSSITNFDNAFLSYFTVLNTGYSLWHPAGTSFSLKGDTCGALNPGYNAFLLNNGAVYYICLLGGNSIYEIIIDVNGDKPPNVIGRDIFAVIVLGKTGQVISAGNNSYSSIPVVAPASSNNCYESVSPGEPCDNTHFGWGCSTTKLLN